jgi:ABC-type transport system involved in multi-copper enzyme maturation permease subunit
MAIFILLQQIFSTLAKTTGTAILAGISIWLFYFLFFGLIILAVSSIMNYQYNSTEFIILANRLSLFSPSQIYSYLIIVVSPTGNTTFQGIPDWGPVAANVIWFVVLFVLALEIFRRRPFL